MVHCIYCGRFVSSNSQGDHVVSQSTGDFEDALYFKETCRRCNNGTSRAEQEVFSRGLESELRCLNGWVHGGRLGARRGVWSKPPQPARPTKYTVSSSTGLKVPVEFDHAYRRGTDLPSMFTVTYADGSRAEIPVGRMKDAQALKRAVTQRGRGNKWREIQVDARADFDSAYELVFRAFPDSVPRRPPTSTPGLSGVFPIECHTECNGPLYFRGIAKTVFHFFLCVFAQIFTGREGTFKDIRRFIRGRGGKVSDFFLETGPFSAIPPQSDFETVRHILAVDASGPVIVGAVMFYASGKWQSTLHHLRLSDFRNPVPYGLGVRCVEYVYNPMRTDRTSDGRVFRRQFPNRPWLFGSGLIGRSEVSKL